MGRVLLCALVALTACSKKKAAENQDQVARRTEADKNEPPPPADAAPAVPPPSAPPATGAQQVQVESLAKPITVDAQVPSGWIRRDPISTWDPPEHDLPMWHRSYEITATCDGGCTPAELAKKVPSYLDAVVEHRRKPNMSGNPDQDAKAIAPVKVIERGELPQGGAFVMLRVEKPPEFAKDDYPDVFAGTCVTRRPDDEFMVVTQIQAAPADETTWWPVLVAACKATTIAAVP